jgi:hypothetical protein
MKRSEAIKMRAIIEKSVVSLNDTDALEVPTLFPVWVEGESYSADERICYNGILYRCIIAHNSQADWTPDIAVSLWVRVDDPSIEYPEWRQPTGAHDAYTIGAKVSYNGKKWVNTIEANTYAPDVYGWDEINL